MKPRNSGDQSPRDSYGSLEVSELFCASCQQSQPVRKHLLLVLPTGSRYELRCGVCGESVGAKEDNDRSLFDSTLELS